MKWITHQRIAKDVMFRLGLHLSEEELSQLLEGVIAPDKWKDWPHHYGKSNEIRHNLTRARHYFLNGDLLNAYYYLGVALHYIQDSYTTYPSFLTGHEDWEQWIENSYLVSNIEDTIQSTVRNQFQRNICSLNAREILNDVQGRDNTLRIATLNGYEKTYNSIASPKVDLYLGYWTSFVISKSVLGPKNCPELENELRSIINDYVNRMQSEEIAYSNKIIKLFRERDELSKKKTSGDGIVVKIKNWITSLSIKAKERELKHSLYHYSNRDHLNRIAYDYDNQTKIRTTDYLGWYNFKIPQISVNNITQELLTIQEVSRILELESNNLRDLLTDKNFSTHSIHNNEVVKRTDLNQFLQQNPLNGHLSYPK
jgi:hypothetical protein